MEERMTGKKVSSLVFMGLAALYDVSPVDIIPDIPVVGWIDDILITLTAFLNCIQQFTKETAHTLSIIAKILKWILVLLGGILIVLLFFAMSSIIGMVNK